MTTGLKFENEFGASWSRDWGWGKTDNQMWSIFPANFVEKYCFKLSGFPVCVGIFLLTYSKNVNTWSFWPTLVKTCKKAHNAFWIQHAGKKQPPKVQYSLSLQSLRQRGRNTTYECELCGRLKEQISNYGNGKLIWFDTTCLSWSYH